MYRVTVLHEEIESATALVFEPCRVYVSVSSGQNESFLYRATLREDSCFKLENIVYNHVSERRVGARKCHFFFQATETCSRVGRGHVFFYA